MIFAIIVTAITLLIGIWNLTIAILGLFPNCQATAVGTLTQARTERNVRGRRGGTIPFLTHFTYQYTVKGKQYRYRGEIHRSRRGLQSRATMVFVKWFSSHAYPNKLTSLKEWAFGISFFMVGVLFTIVILIG